MKNTKKKLTAIILTVAFGTMQTVAFGAATNFTTTNGPIDTNLGAGNGGAVIKDVVSKGNGFQGVDLSNNSATLKFTNDSFVNWKTLNVNKGETLNFNAVNGATGLTVINAVEQGMSRFAGNVNSNAGIGKLIISNPNGMLFDGAKFTTTGDCELTTRNYSSIDFQGGASGWPFSNGYGEDGKLKSITIKDSTFDVYGDFTISSAYVSAEASKVNTNTFKITTYNGLDYTQNSAEPPVNNKGVTFLKAMQIDGDVYITNPEGAMSISNGGTINGNLNVNTKGNTFVNYYNEDKKVLTVNGDTNVTSHGQWAFVRDADIKGNLTMSNDGGFVDVGNSKIAGNANLTTTGVEQLSSSKYNHYVHVVGNTSVGGDLNIEASQNVHIGGYDYDAKQLASGKLTVGGDLNAHSTDGHITTTIDTTAKNIRYTSDKLNVLTDDKAVLTADTYEFKSNGYIGGISDYQKPDGSVLKKDDQIVSLMENYTYIPNGIKSQTYTNIAGGKITKLETPTNAYIASKGDLEVTGADAKNINLTAYNNSKITIENPDVKAENVNIGPETGYLKLNFPGRKFTTNYTNIKEGVVKTIAPDEVITYELTDGPNGYNQPTLTPGEKTTYLIGPDPEIIPPPPGPEPKPQPKPDPKDPSEPERNLMTQWVPDDIMQAPINTPVAFAADLDDDDNGQPVRKNVDGSVTVVRAFPMMN